MEAAPANKAFRLTKAKTESYAAAITSNEAAADEYSKAAEDIEDGEALRALKLLEEHHKRLVNILKSIEQRPQNKSASAEEAFSDQEGELDANEATLTVPERTSSPESRRKPREYAASSLATNLASARGIPYAQQQKQRNSSPYSAADRLRAQRLGQSRPDSRTSSKQVDTLQHTRDAEKRNSNSKSPATTQSANDAAFQKFYSTFEGLFSKLSAPLAFAGLPLNATPTEDAEADQLVSAEKVHSGPEVEIDVNKLYSKAAIKALQDANGGFPGVQESFLVVPGSSSTPYGKLSGGRSSLDEDGQELFVDAQDNMAPSSPVTSRKQTAGKGPSTNKTIEELEMENAQLKQLTDKISRRLYDWEKMAQKQGAVLQQSIRMSGSVVGTASMSGGGNKPQQEADARVSELEAQLKAAQKENERNGRENEKLKGVVVRYRERWDKLKEGARNRRESSEQGNGA